MQESLSLLLKKASLVNVKSQVNHFLEMKQEIDSETIQSEQLILDSVIENNFTIKNQCENLSSLDLVTHKDGQEAQENTEYLQCQLCCKFIHNSVMCKCSKLFCLCINEISPKDSLPNSPFCSEPMNFIQIPKHLIFVFNKQIVNCPIKGCLEAFAYKNLKLHLKQHVVATCKSCKEEIFTSKLNVSGDKSATLELMQHVEECCEGLIECANCMDNIKYNDLVYHQKYNCEPILIKCEYCEQYESLSNLKKHNAQLCYPSLLNKLKEEIIELKAGILKLEEDKRNLKVFYIYKLL